MNANAGGQVTPTRRHRCAYSVEESYHAREVSTPEVYEMWQMGASTADSQPYRIGVLVNGVTR